MSSFPKQLRLGTRSSRLALWQADFVSARLREQGVGVEIVPIETTGDKDRVSDFGSLGAKGVFVKEIEIALLESRIDLAVHSLKDVPTELAEGLALASVLEREAPFDALVSRENMTLADLPEGSTLATGSLRRAAQVLALRPDLKVVPIRGNVPTRVEKIRRGEADATLLALAGIRRLGLESEVAEVFSVEIVTPAMGQGAVAIESRMGEHASLFRSIQHQPTRDAVEAERRFTAAIGGGCKTPVGVLVEPGGGDGWDMTAVIASTDGRSLLRRTRPIESTEGLLAEAEALAEAMFDEADAAIRATLARQPLPGTSGSDPAS